MNTEFEISDVYEGSYILIKSMIDNVTISLDRQNQMKLCVWLAKNREVMIETALVAVKEDRIQKWRDKHGR